MAYSNTFYTMQKLKPYQTVLLVLSFLGFLLINVPFLYIATFEKEIYAAAMENWMAMVFMTEAFLLMFMGAWLIAKCGFSSPGWVAFIIYSLLGSLAFSIPFFLYQHVKASEKD